MSEILRKQFLRHIAQTSPSPQLIEVARAEGVFFYTPEGKPYYDLISGVSVSNVGHANILNLRGEPTSNRGGCTTIRLTILSSVIIYLTVVTPIL